MIVKTLMGKIWFVLVLFPYILFIFVLAVIGWNTYRINTLTDGGGMVEKVAEYLAGPRGTADVRVVGGEMHISYRYVYPDRPDRGFSRELPFSPETSSYKVYVYGSSPVVARPPFAEKGFMDVADVLEAEMNSSDLFRKTKVYNMGLTSADSRAINDIARLTVGIEKPDVMVYYYGGGMDLEAAYYAAGIKAAYYPARFMPEPAVRWVYGLMEQAHISGAMRYAVWLNRMYLQPYLINFLQVLGVLRIDTGPFTMVNEMVYDDLYGNLEEFIDIGVSADIPVIVVVPLSNLEAEPYGVYGTTHEYYKEGMAAADPAEKEKLLMEARDTELFTGDLGPRTRTYAMLESAAVNAGGEDVFLLDMRDIFAGRGIVPGYDHFYDYGHMKPGLHETIASSIYELMEESGLTAAKNIPEGGG